MTRVALRTGVKYVAQYGMRHAPGTATSAMHIAQQITKAATWAGEHHILPMYMGGAESGLTRALTAGADDYVLKPFDRETLRGKFAATGLI